MNDIDFIEVVIRDGNRTVNWMFPEKTAISHVLDKWEREYHKCDRKTVRIGGRLLLADCDECQLNFFSKKMGNKISIRVESIQKGEQDG